MHIGDIIFQLAVLGGIALFVLSILWFVRFLKKSKN